MMPAPSPLEALAQALSHDLRSPIRAVRGFADLLANTPHDGLDDEQRLYLHRLRASSDRLDAMVARLVDYLRVGQPDLHLAPVAPKPLIERTVSALRADTAFPGAVIDIRVASEAWQTDAALLQTIAEALLRNALLYHQPGEPPQIRIDASSTPDGARLCVMDRGIGIEARHHDRIFGLFKRLHTAQEYPGLGMDLAIAARSAEVLGGRLEVTSALGCGSTFTLKLPGA